MRVAHVCADFQPVGQLVVGLQSAGDTLIIRIGRDTLVAQVVERSEERGLVRAGGGRQRILLAQAGLVGSVCPVVRQQHIVLSVVVHDVAQRGVGVQLAVGTNHVLAFGHRIYIITQTVCIVGRQMLVGHVVSLHVRIALSVHEVVLQGTVPHFIILGRAVHIFVVRQSA